MAKSAAKVSLITALSRVLGYVRDAISAALLGVGPVSDAFFVAFRIPNMLRSLLAEGALSSAFVPVFTDYLIKKEKKDVWLLAANAMTALSVLLVAVTVVGVLFAGPIVRVMAPGFVNDPEKFSLTVSLTRALFPFILLVSVAALLMGILNSLKKFSMPAFAPVILNVSMILSGFFICPRLGDMPEQQVWGWVIGALFGAFLEIIIQWIPAARSGFAWKFLIDLRDEGLRRIARLMAPAVLAQSVTQLNLLVSTIFASMLAGGAVTYLYYGNRLMQLPFGVFGVAIATVSFPYISSCVSNNDYEGLRLTIHNSLKQAFFIVIPCSAGLIFLSGPINAMLFYYGRFGLEDAMATANVSIIYCTAIFAFSAIKILTQVFYALNKARAAVKISLASVFINIALSAILMKPLDYLGLAAATAGAGIIQFVLLYVMVEKYAGNIRTRELVVYTMKILILSALMGLIVMLMSGAMTGYFNPEMKRSVNALIVFACIATGTAFYFAAAVFMKISEAKQMLGFIKQKLALK